MTTVEGIIADTIRDLDLDQPARLELAPEIHAKIQTLLDSLKLIVEEDKEEGAVPTKMPVFTIKLDDPSGNSFVETHGGLADPKWSKRDYTRDLEQDVALGLRGREEKVERVLAGDDMEDEKPEEVLSFPTTCSLCGSELETLMKTVNIPHFKVRCILFRSRLTELQDIILMSTNCHDCGYRDNEIKSGGAIAPLGRKITLKVVDTDDLSRDILKVRFIVLSHAC